MDSDIFSLTIEDRNIVLQSAADVARFSFIVQDSVSYLDLKLCQKSRMSDYFRSLCDSCRSRGLRNFVNTEEKCRKFFAPRRRLLYTLHLDLPKGRECSLKDDVPESVNYMGCSRSPHIAEITLTCGFHYKNLSNLIEDALRINFPKQKILKWIVKIPFLEVPLLSRLDIRTASKFMDCFYPEVTDSELFNDFIFQFDIIDWLEEYEQPEILEYLVYHARLHGNISLEDELEREIECISLCIYNQHYKNIGPILKYISDSMPTYTDYEDYLSKISSERPRLTENVIEKAEESISVERICRMMQIIWVYIDSRIHGFQEAASEAVRLIWSSVPDACVTFKELKNVFGAALSEEELMNVCDFYIKAIGECHEYIEPRSLKHLCRTVLRRTFEENDLWIPDGISRTGLPNSLQSFLNLEKPFAV